MLDTLEKPTNILSKEELLTLSEAQLIEYLFSIIFFSKPHDVDFKKTVLFFENIRKIYETNNQKIKEFITRFMTKIYVYRQGVSMVAIDFQKPYIQQDFDYILKLIDNNQLDLKTKLTIINVLFVVACFIQDDVKIQSLFQLIDDLSNRYPDDITIQQKKFNMHVTKLFYDISFFVADLEIAILGNRLGFTESPIYEQDIENKIRNFLEEYKQLITSYYHLPIFSNILDRIKHDLSKAFNGEIQIVEQLVESKKIQLDISNVIDILIIIGYKIMYLEILYFIITNKPTEINNIIGQMRHFDILYPTERRYVSELHEIVRDKKTFTGDIRIEELGKYICDNINHTIPGTIKYFILQRLLHDYSDKLDFKVLLDIYITLLEKVDIYYSPGHNERLWKLSEKIYEILMKNLHRLPKQHADYLKTVEKGEFEYIGRLHDLGKLMVDWSILWKSTKLTDEEWENVKKHPTFSRNVFESLLKHIDIESFANMGENMGFSTNFFNNIIYGFYHHERYDGRGYPLGLSGDKINIITIILTIADAIDAIMSKRIYYDPNRPPKTVEDVINDLKTNSGTIFHPDVIKILLSNNEFANFLNDFYSGNTR